MEMLSLVASFYRVGRCCAHSWEHTSDSSRCKPPEQKRDLPIKVGLLGQQWHRHCESNLSLSDEQQVPFHKVEHIHCTVVRVRNLWLGRPQTLGEKCITSILLNGHSIKPTPNDLLLYLQINLSLNPPPQKKISQYEKNFIVDDNQDRNPLLFNIQRMKDYKALDPKFDIYLT